MSDDVITGGSAPRGRLAAAIRDESGAARHDRLLLLGGGAILGALVLFSWVTDEPASETAAAVRGAGAEAPLRSVTSSASRPPEPPSSSDPGASRGYVSSDYPSLQLAPPDREEALLDALTEPARAVDAAAFAAGAFGDAPEGSTDAAAEPDAETGTETAADGT